ncbi:MAG: DUF3298 and DUF4163 domain-containing protein [Bacteroidetes bacterium]|nr:DUF3298 and DUF4163 domain-containing protein [Bacteroidota bacterium]
MKNNITTSTLIFLLAAPAFQACKNDPPKEPESAKPVTLESLAIEKKTGPDCDKVDSLRLNCVEISLRYPKIKEGSEALKPIVDAWATDFMTGMVGYAEEPDNLPPLEEAIQAFVNMHDEMVKEMPDGPLYYTAETKDTVLLNDGKHLTLRMDGYTYVGGAHGNSTSIVATWDVATAQKVTLDQLVTDLGALQQLAEKKFREVKAEVFKPESEGGWGFNFDESNPFKLADNTGLVKDGIYFCYVPYEVGAYAMGSTEFVIPFAEIQNIRK